jgi:hypothetical protein
LFVQVQKTNETCFKLFLNFNVSSIFSEIWRFEGLLKNSLNWIPILLSQLQNKFIENCRLLCLGWSRYLQNRKAFLLFIIKWLDFFSEMHSTNNFINVCVKIICYPFNIWILLPSNCSELSWIWFVSTVDHHFARLIRSYIGWSYINHRRI